MEVPSSEVEKKCPSAHGSSYFWAKVQGLPAPSETVLFQAESVFPNDRGTQENLLRTLTTVLDREGLAAYLVQPRSACHYVMASPFNLNELGSSLGRRNLH